MLQSQVVSLYDYSGEAVRPWAEAGYDCYCYDIQHVEETVEAVGQGRIHYCHADLHDLTTHQAILERHVGHVALGIGFPVCDDLAVSGTRHWKKKFKKDPCFQEIAADHCKRAGELLDQLCDAWLVENPVGRLRKLWRKWDYIFHPCDYGGYLPEDDVHPSWPEYIPPRDAYEKKTCLWTGNGFTMPERRRVEPIRVTKVGKDGSTATGSPQWAHLGGKSQKTKNIRSASPRGFFRAVFIANGGEEI